eukprot:390885_1
MYWESTHTWSLVDNSRTHLLLVDVRVGRLVPLDHFLGLEPKGDLMLSRLNGIGTMTDVTADVDREVTTDGTGERVGRVGGAEENATGLDDTLALPHHGDNGARGEEVGETAKEGRGGEVG